MDSQEDIVPTREAISSALTNEITFFIATKAFSQHLQRYATGLKVFRFKLDDLKNIYIPNLSLIDQNLIATFLDQETSKIDTLVTKQKTLIEKLKEYRSSIISHVVTGKIDIREFC